MSAFPILVDSAFASLGPHELNLDEFTSALQGSGWLGRALTNPLIWGVAAAITGSVLLAIILTTRRSSDLKRHRPAWRRLARSLQLDADQRRLLEHLARSGGNINPAPLVISRGCFDRAVQRHRSRQRRAEIDGLRRHLFD